MWFYKKVQKSLSMHLMNETVWIVSEVNHGAANTSDKKWIEKLKVLVNKDFIKKMNLKNIFWKEKEMRNIVLKNHLNVSFRIYLRTSMWQVRFSNFREDVPINVLGYL